MQVPSPGREDPLEEGVAPHSSIPAWRIPWTEEPGGLQSVHRATESDTIKLTQQQPPHSTLPGAQPQWSHVQWLPSQRERSLPPTSLCSSKTDLGDIHSDQEGADPSPDRAVTSTGGRPRSTSHTPHQWDSGQDTQQHLYYKSRPCTKHDRPTRATTQGGSHTRKKKPSKTTVSNCFS